jgi:hypothetical protein
MKESNFYKKIKNRWKSISFIRLENRALLGTPDLLCQNSNGTFFTLELKICRVTKGSVSLSPHQVSFHMKHKKNTFVLVASSLDPELVRLYPGSRILELVNLGINGAGPPLAEGLDACASVLERL